MLKYHIRRAVIGGLIGLLLFGAYALFSAKQYEGRSELLVGAALLDKYAPRPSAVPDDVLEILERGQPQSYVTEIEVLRSEGLFMQALQQVAQKDNDQSLLVPETAQRLFLLYDVQNQPESSVAEIKARGPSPQVAADLSNAILDAYNASREKRASDADKEAQAYLDTQVKASLHDVVAAETKVRDFKKANDISDLQVKASYLSLVGQGLSTNKTLVEGQYRGAEAEVASLQAQLARTDPVTKSSSQTIRNGEIDRLMASLDDAEAKKAHDLADYQPESVFVQEDNQTIQSLQKALAVAQKKQFNSGGDVTANNPVYEQLREALTNAESRRDSLAKQLTVVEQDYAANIAANGQLPQDQKVLASLQRDVELSDLRYRQVKTISDDLQSRAVAGAHASQVLLRAVPDEQVVAPNLLKYTAVGLFGGVIFGLLYSFGFESLRLRVYTSSQVSELTGVPVAASLPMTKGAGTGAAALSLYARNTETPVPEALKYIAFTDLVSGSPKHKSVMFTEGGNALGGQTAALQYAIVLSGTGLRVLLVDADLRRRSLSRAFGLDTAAGLGDIIEHTLLPGSDASLIHETVHPNLSFLPAGMATDHAISSATSHSIEGATQYITQAADVIVVSAPPCDQYADASRLASYVDEVFLVIAAHRTSLPSVPRARDLLVTAGAKDVKVVLAGAERDDDGLTLQPRAPAA